MDAYGYTLIAVMIISLFIIICDMYSKPNIKDGTK